MLMYKSRSNVVEEGQDEENVHGGRCPIHRERVRDPL